MNDKKKTNVVVQIDYDVWEMLKGLAKFKQIDRQELLEKYILAGLIKEGGK